MTPIASLAFILLLCGSCVSAVTPLHHADPVDYFQHGMGAFDVWRFRSQGALLHRDSIISL
jgi:hypothetical protein